MYIALIKNESAGTYASYLTSGKTYIAERIDADKINPTTIYKRPEYFHNYELYRMYSDSDIMMYTTIANSSHLNGEDWEVIESFEV